MNRLSAFLFVACLFSAIAPAHRSASAVEIPDGIETNLQMGDFGENEYIGLETVLVEPWWNSQEEGERTLVEVELDYQEPDYEDEPMEKISIAFGVWDSKKKALITKAMGGSVQSSGPFEFKWDMRDQNGEKVPDGIYRVVMNITGEHYGDLLRNAGFPLYITSGGPTLENEGISTRQAVLEYDGAPVIKFTTTNINTVTAVDFDEDDNELGSWERVLGPDNHTLKSDLKDKDSEPFKPGKYGTRVTVSNPFGEAKEFVVRYTLREPDPLEASIELGADGQVMVDENTTIPYTITLNQNAYVILQHLSEGGANHYIGVSTAEKPAVLAAKGTYTNKWNRRPSADSNSHYTKGTHWLRITATSLTGEEVVAETGKVTLAAKPKEERRAPGIDLKLSPDHVVIGGRMQTTVTYSLDMDAHVRVALYHSGSNTAIKDLAYKQAKKGTYSIDLAIDSLEVGNYEIVFTATHRNGNRRISKILSVGWK